MQDKDGKNTTMNCCHFKNSSLACSNENNSFDKNLLEGDNAINEIFSNDKDEEILIPLSKKPNVSYLKI